MFGNSKKKKIYLKVTYKLKCLVMCSWVLGFGIEKVKQKLLKLATSFISKNVFGTTPFKLNNVSGWSIAKNLAGGYQLILVIAETMHT